MKVRGMRWLAWGGWVLGGGLIAGAGSATVPPATASASLAQLEQADQADRRPGPAGIDWTRVAPLDAERRRAVLHWLARGDIRSAADYFNAAVIMQHGDTSRDARLALAFATLAAQLDPARIQARQMTAMSWDRLLQDLGQPQWYGTQYVRATGTGAWVLYPVQAHAVSDSERIALGLPTLAQSRAHLAAIRAAAKPGSGHG